MNTLTRTMLILCMLCLSAVSSAKAGDRLLLCGLAQGFPPYQYQDAEGRPMGLDAEVMRMVFREMRATYEFRQAEWDDVVGRLCYGGLDCVGGMEMTEERLKCFDFTFPYYSRQITLFVQKDNTRIRGMDDLEWQILAGDRHSSVEDFFEDQGVKKRIRLIQTASKDESMRLLKEGVVAGVIAPAAVGYHLAKKYGVQVKTVEIPSPASPVAIAVKKGNVGLLRQLNKALRELQRRGELKAVVDRWLH